MWNSSLGKWMATVAFKFDERDSSIKLLWELNQRRKLILDLRDELNKLDEKSKEYEKIINVAFELSYEYVLLDEELMKYYNNL